MDERKTTLPKVGSDVPFVILVKSLATYFVHEITLPSTFEQLRTTSAGNSIKGLVDHLVLNCSNRAIVNALLTLKWHFSSLDPDDRNMNETRANACEIVAWRFLTRISERDAVEYCLHELPSKSRPGTSSSNYHDEPATHSEPTERSNLLTAYRPNMGQRTLTKSRQAMRRAVSQSFISQPEAEEDDGEEDPTSSFTGLNGLEIAAVADCKRFLSQRVVQKIITGIWNGDITFWANLSEHTHKQPAFYNKRKSDPFTRLRVPKYVKMFEVLFFASFIALFYGVLLERNPMHVNTVECFLLIWLGSFAYDELSGFIDAGSILYAVDIWNSCDFIIVIIGMAFFVCRVIGLLKHSREITEIAFDILSLEALFMVPRIFSLLSLHPYFGRLIPCLKAMTKDFLKFMIIVAVLYLGFLTTFTLLARDTFTAKQMSWILVKVFFGSTYIGFDIMSQISPQLGPPLMLTFVVMTNFLVLTALISILSNTFSSIIAHAREEYLFVYSVYVLEASTSNRLTHFYPPLNLIPLLTLRPLRLFISADSIRRARIMLLKGTHLPFVGLIIAYEFIFSTEESSHRPAFSALAPATTATSTVSTGNSIKKQPFLSRTAKLRNDGGPNGENGVGGRPGSSHSGHTTEIGADGRDEAVYEGEERERLEKKVEDLAEKIAQLTALMLAEKGNPQDDAT